MPGRCPGKKALATRGGAPAFLREIPSRFSFKCLSALALDPCFYPDQNLLGPLLSMSSFLRFASWLKTRALALGVHRVPGVRPLARSLRSAVEWVRFRRKVRRLQKKDPFIY